jgi:hypothetical protein
LRFAKIHRTVPPLIHPMRRNDQMVGTDVDTESAVFA